MGAVIGDLLPLALGVAISPVPIIAVILMLLAPQASRTSIGFLIGWLAGIVVAATVLVVIADAFGLGDTSSSASTKSGWTKIVLGALLILLAGRQWRGRPKPGETASLPKWMAAIDSFTAVRGAALAFALAALNPKNLLFIAGAAVVISNGQLAGGQQAVAILVFTVIAALTVAVPVIGYLVARERMRGPLDELKVWLTVNNVAVMAVLILVIGVVLLGKGIGILST